MKYVVSALAVSCTILLVLASGCADVTVKQKVGDFGTAFGTSSEEQKAIDWFTATYGDPRTNNDQSPRFIEPLITTGVTDKNMPVDKVTVFPVSGGSVYFWVIYDNFKSSDPITITWTYMENGKVVTTVDQNAGGDFGRFIAEFEKPDTGWGKGNQKITVSGRGTSSEVTFTIGDTLQTTALPYNPSGTAATGTTIVNPAITRQPIAGATLERSVVDPRLGGSGIITPTTTSAQPLGFRTVVVTAVGIAPVTTTLVAISTSSDPKNCGSVGKICPTVSGATSTCSGGVCGYTCRDFYADCNQNPTDGCEAYLGVAENCGACGNICSFQNGWGGCSNGQCELTGCNQGWYDCNGDPADGCEINIWSKENCGTCGKQCDAGKYCLRGGCVIDCPYPNIITYDGVCTDPYTDPKNCGVRGKVCPNPPNAVGVCEKGTCTFTCNKPGYGTDTSGKYGYLIFGNCDNNAANGCETDLDRDESCGTCGNKCDVLHYCAWGECLSYY